MKRDSGMVLLLIVCGMVYVSKNKKMMGGRWSKLFRYVSVLWVRVRTEDERRLLLDTCSIGINELCCRECD